MKYKTFFLLLCSFVYANAQSCGISDVPGTLYILDTDLETNIFSRSTTAKGVDVDVQCDGACDNDKAAKYFTAEITGGTIDLFTTDAFANVDEDAYTNGSNLTITIIFKLTCDVGSSSTDLMLVSIGDTNNHDPRFLNDELLFNVAVPIMPKTDFSVYGNPIEAEDIDFSNQMVTFTIEPPDFTITSVQTGNKTFKAVFSANQLIRFSSDKTYTITATDSGTNPGPRSVSADVKLSVDVESSLDNPSFSKATYAIAYSEVSGSSMLTPDDDITILSNKIDGVTVALDGEYESYFKVERKGNLLTVTSDGWPEESGSVVVLTISFETDSVASATLVITRDEELDRPTFESSYYTFSYRIEDDNPILVPTAGGDITVRTNKPASITNITLEGVYEKHFKCSPESDNTKITVEPTGDALPSYIESPIVLILSVQTDATTSTVLIINVEDQKDEPTFTELYYAYNYRQNGDVPSLEATNGPPSVETDKPDQISDVALTGEYGEYFDFERNEKTFTISIAEGKELPIAAPNPVILTLSLKTDNVANVPIVVSIGNTTVADVPVFSKAFYTFTYSESEGELTPPSDAISVETQKPNDISDINLDGDYGDYFTVTHAANTKTFSISVKDGKTLPPDTPNPVLLTLSVRTDRSASVAIIVAIEESPETVLDVPTFPQNFYSFNYSEKSLISNDGPIYVVTKKPGSITDVQIDGDYAKYFSWKQGGNETSFLLAVEDDLPSDVKSAVTLKFSVKTDTRASVILIVFIGNDLPAIDIDVPTFSRSYYSFSYTENDGEARLISNDGDVLVKTEKSESITDLKLSGDYSNYFQTKLDKATIILSVTHTLPNDTSTPVILILSLATDVETSVNLIVNIKKADATPQFSSPYYVATYNATSKHVEMEDDIEISGNPTLKISDDSTCSTYFDLVKEGKGYRLTVTKDLPSDVLEEPSLVLVVVAQINGKDIAYATVVINLPVPSVLPPERIENSSTITAYMITVIVLCVVLTGIIAAMILLWYFKIRNTSYVELEETSNGTPNFGKKASNVNIDDVIRRPTGYPFGPQGNATYTVAEEDTGNEYAIPDDPELDKGKKVAFDNVVQSIDVDVDRELSEGGNSLPRRRPTGFVFNPPPPEEDAVSLDNPIYKSEYEIPINSTPNDSPHTEPHIDRLNKIDSSSNGLTFGYPLEEGLYEPSETSDSLGIDKERKKSVAFDDRIERMQIEAVKDDDDTENEERAV